MRIDFTSWIAPLLLLALTNATVAQIQEIGPFEGELFEGFESFGLTFVPALDVFEDAVTLSGTTGPPAVFVVGSSTVGGVTVLPHSGSALGGCGEPADWIFHTPAGMFGGYFATNSGADDATADFFDPQDNLIASLTVNFPGQEKVAWVWNGWVSDIPIKRIRITGNGINNGFVDYDDMQLTLATGPPSAVPTASHWALVLFAFTLVAVGVLAIRRRRAPR